MNRFKKYAAFFILSALGLYIIFAIYLKIVGREMAHQAIDSLKQSHPEIQGIEYQQVLFSPYDFFRKQIALEGITIKLNNSNAVFEIGLLRCIHFMSLKQNPLGSFTLQIQNLRVNSLPNLYTSLTTWSDSPFLYNQLEYIPNNLQISLDGEAQYQAQEQTLSLNLKAHEEDLSFLNYAVTLQNIKLTPLFFSNALSFSNTMNAAQVTQMAYSANINTSINTTTLQSALPIVSNLLQNMGYTTLPLHLQVDSQYAASDQMQNIQASLNINNLGAAQFQAKLIKKSPPSAGSFANFILNPSASQEESAPDFIQSASLTYTDASLINRLLQFLSATTGQSIADVQATLEDNLDQFFNTLQIPQLESIGNTLNDFITNPASLTVSLNPPSPFSTEDISHFFATQKKMNSAIQANLNKLSNTQKEVFFDRYQNASITAYSLFLNQIGLSVTAN